MESCRRDFQGHAQLFHVGGGGALQLCGKRKVRQPRDQPSLSSGGFSIWTILQGAEDMGAAIAASNTDTVALDGRNAQANQIARAAHVVLRVIVGLPTM